MDASPFVPVGRVRKARPAPGSVYVKPSGRTIGPPPAGATVWFVPPTEGLRSGRVLAAEPAAVGWMLSVEGLGSPEESMALSGSKVLVHRDQLEGLVVEPAAGVVGIEVTDALHGHLGAVEDIIVTGANDVWVVRGPHGEVLIPVIDDVVLAVDEARGTAQVRLPRGLMPGEGEAVL